MVAIAFGDRHGGRSYRAHRSAGVPSLSATYQNVETESPMHGCVATFSIGNLFLRSFDTIQTPPAFLRDRGKP